MRSFGVTGKAYLGKLFANRRDFLQFKNVQRMN